MTTSMEKCVENLNPIRKHSRRLAVLAVLVALACLGRPALGEPKNTLPYDNGSGKVLFMIQTKGGVASSLQELTALPEFALYGDGTAIWTRYSAAKEMRVVWTTHLSPQEVQKELDFIDAQGYNGWYDRYEDTNLPNLPTTTFTLNFKEQSIRRLVYGFQYCTKNKTIPDGFSRLYDHFVQYKHPDETPYESDRVLLFARKLPRLEAKRGYRTLNWGIKQVTLSEFAREGQEFGQKELSGKDAERVVSRLKKWTLFSTDLSVIFFKEKKTEYQLGYRPVLPGE